MPPAAVAHVGSGHLAAQDSSHTTNGYINHPTLNGHASTTEKSTSGSKSEADSTPKMTGQKMVDDSDPRNHARDIAANLTLEEQVVYTCLPMGTKLTFPGFITCRRRFLEDCGHSKQEDSFLKDDGWSQWGQRSVFHRWDTSTYAFDHLLQDSADILQAALFPCGVSLAATWNTALIHEVGEHLGEETKARGANILLGPTICIHRSPLGGRNFESFSEDPHLTGKLAAAYINGLQSRGIAATPKHFVGNEQETHRNFIDSVIQERPLRELYLKPFEIALRESSPWALMTSYNQINGVHADMNKHTLKDILRGEWKYDG